MKSKKSVLLACAAICLMAAPIAMAAGHGHPSASFSRPGFNGSRSSFAAHRGSFRSYGRPQFSHWSNATARNWHGAGNWHHGGDWRHGHHHRFNNVFFADFGYPYYGYGWDYPYYGYEDYPYDSDYNSYDNGGRVYDGRVYEGRRNAALVLQVQRRLARSGYYHGRIDGVPGGGTRSAIRAYERSHRLPVDGVIDPDLLATMGLS